MCRAACRTAPYRESARHAQNAVRMQLKWVRIALSEFNQCRSHSITVSLSEPASERIMCMESTSFHELHCDSSHVGELRFSYIY